MAYENLPWFEVCSLRLCRDQHLASVPPLVSSPPPVLPPSLALCLPPLGPKSRASIQEPILGLKEHGNVWAIESMSWGRGIGVWCLSVSWRQEEGESPSFTCLTTGSECFGAYPVLRLTHLSTSNCLERQSLFLWFPLEWNTDKVLLRHNKAIHPNAVPAGCTLLGSSFEVSRKNNTAFLVNLQWVSNT